MGKERSHPVKARLRPCGRGERLDRRGQPTCRKVFEILRRLKLTRVYVCSSAVTNISDHRPASFGEPGFFAAADEAFFLFFEIQ